MEVGPWSVRIITDGDSVFRVSVMCTAIKDIPESGEVFNRMLEMNGICIGGELKTSNIETYFLGPDSMSEDKSRDREYRL